MDDNFLEKLAWKISDKIFEGMEEFTKQFHPLILAELSSAGLAAARSPEQERDLAAMAKLRNHKQTLWYDALGYHFVSMTDRSHPDSDPAIGILGPNWKPTGAADEEGNRSVQRLDKNPEAEGGLLGAIAAGEADIKAGRIHTLDEAFKEVLGPTPASEAKAGDRCGRCGHERKRHVGLLKDGTNTACMVSLRMEVCACDSFVWPQHAAEQAQGKQCPHEIFDANVNVNRLSDTKRFSADVTIHCRQCNVPMRFLGLPAGLDMEGAAVSADGTEARLSIAPQGEVVNAIEGAPIGFTIRKMEVTAPKPEAGMSGRDFARGLLSECGTVRLNGQELLTASLIDIASAFDSYVASHAFVEPQPAEGVKTVDEALCCDCGHKAHDGRCSTDTRAYGRCYCMHSTPPTPTQPAAEHDARCPDCGHREHLGTCVFGIRDGEKFRECGCTKAQPSEPLPPEETEARASADHERRASEGETNLKWLHEIATNIKGGKLNVFGDTTIESAIRELTRLREKVRLVPQLLYWAKQYQGQCRMDGCGWKVADEVIAAAEKTLAEGRTK